MRHINRIALLLVIVGAGLRADVMITTSLGMTSLQIAPSAGTLEIQSPLAASAFTSVFDSLGGADQQFNTINDSSTSAAASTSLASANGSASNALTVSASSFVDIGSTTAQAGTNAVGPYGALSGSFEIADSSGQQNPVNVNFSAALNGNQSLTTDAAGVGAFSEIIFQLNLPDLGASGAPLLFLDNPLQIGPSSSLNSPTYTTLSQTAALMTNTPYSFYVEADAESLALNETPEPAYQPAIAFIVAALFGLAWLRQRNKRKWEYRPRATAKARSNKASFSVHSAAQKA